jgi:DNA-binding Xre family transcriptional regulator
MGTLPRMKRGERKVAPHWIKVVVAENVNALMKKRGIGAIELAKLSKVGRKSIDRLRAGKNSTLDTLGAVADVLEVQPANLLMPPRPASQPLLRGSMRNENQGQDFARFGPAKRKTER